MNIEMRTDIQPLDWGVETENIILDLHHGWLYIFSKASYLVEGVPAISWFSGWSSPYELQWHPFQSFWPLNGILRIL